uniref:Putative udp-glucoronosyl and udp-glucosyl transferase n=1 Tax=Lutzomyia longipalpis TaxID=7200 RepID=A0A1B0CNS8_LUTLO
MFLNTFLIGLVERTVWSVIDWRERIYYEENFPSPKYRSYEEMKKNVSLYFVNDHFSITLPRAYLPSVIPVGGLNINSNPDTLPKDIKQFLDGAEHGAILLSLGSCFKASFLPRKTIDIFIKVFSKLRQRILFKWEQDTLPNKPENVMISKWLPQADVLGHRNIKLFITHGGIGAMNEAKYNGVPIIGTPLFADQKTNLASAEREGWAIVLNIKDLTEELLTTAIEGVLNDPKYRNEIQRMSFLFRDRPMSALDTAIYWTEYVIRHKGANHLKSSLIHLNWFQRNSLDVLLAYMVLFYILMTFIAYLRHLRRRRSLGRKLKNEKSKNE